jgi:hypothetical protein
LGALRNHANKSHSLNSTIAYFISPHGFGHAARAAAVMAALHKANPAITFEIFTLVPEWFFAEALPPVYRYHALKTDIGLVQSSPLSEDIPATLRALDAFLPFQNDHIDNIASLLRQTGCRCALCDISPLGILAAKKAGIPAILVENFTWDWIYESYSSDYPGFAKHIAGLREIFRLPDAHILARPFCQPAASPALEVWPVSRTPQKSRKALRTELGLSPQQLVVLITMGGIPESFAAIDHLISFQEVTFIIPGGSTHIEQRQNLILLPHHSSFYHPDLLNACDAAIGKAGYSTIAELFHAGLPFGYFSRAGFRESACLTEFIKMQMQGIQMQGEHISQTTWLNQLPHLLSLPRMERSQPNGAWQIADFLIEEIL